jgi:hypothetical protein
MVGRPREHSEPRHPINLLFPDGLDEKVQERCRKEHTTRTDFIVEAVRQQLGNGETTSIGVTFGGSYPSQQQQKELTPEDEEAILIKNLVNATKDALPIIPYMEVNEFVTEIKRPVIDAIYTHRNPNYKRKAAAASRNDPRLKRILQHKESLLMPQQAPTPQQRARGA